MYNGAQYRMTDHPRVREVLNVRIRRDAQFTAKITKPHTRLLVTVLPEGESASRPEGGEQRKFLSGGGAEREGGRAW